MNSKHLWHQLLPILKKMSQGESAKKELTILEKNINGLPSSLEEFKNILSNDKTLMKCIQKIDTDLMSQAKEILLHGVPYLKGAKKIEKGNDIKFIRDSVDIANLAILQHADLIGLHSAFYNSVFIKKIFEIDYLMFLDIELEILKPLGFTKTEVVSFLTEINNRKKEILIKLDSKTKAINPDTLVSCYKGPKSSDSKAPGEWRVCAAANVAAAFFTSGASLGSLAICPIIFD